METHSVFGELQPRKHASPPENVLTESEENPGLIREHCHQRLSCCGSRSYACTTCTGQILRWSVIMRAAPTNAAIPVPPQPASGAPRVWKIQLPTTLPLRPKTISQSSPYPPLFMRSEERRVGKECRSRWSRDQ